MFGADAIERKYGAEPTPEWIDAIDQLSDEQVVNGLRGLVKSGAAHAPTLPQFVAECRNAREWTKPPSFAALEDKREWGWDIAGNNHLMAHILREGKDGVYFTREQTEILVAYKNAWVEDCKAEAHPKLGIPVARQREMWDDCMARAREAGATGWTPKYAYPKSLDEVRAVRMADGICRDTFGEVA